MTSKQKTDMYAQVTERIVEALENGTVPWRKPWKAIGGIPRNLNSGRPYRGINIFLTMMTSMLNGYADNRWATYKGIKKAGGQVRKGEKSTTVILWRPIEKRDKVTDEVLDRFMLLRGYAVFNVDQADWPDGPPATGEEDELRAHDEHAASEAIIARYVDDLGGPKLERGGNSATYNQITDVCRVPEPEQFESGSAFYHTTFHELTHSTGHETRLHRFGGEKPSGFFGGDSYAREELVAEIGGSMLCAVAGVDEEVESSAAYIANWLRVLGDDRKLVVVAAAQAQKAVDLILGTKFEDEKKESNDGETKD